MGGVVRVLNISCCEVSKKRKENEKVLLFLHTK